MTTKIITSNDKITAALKAHPDLKDKLMQRSALYKRLENPLVFKTVARLASIADVARVAGEDLDELLLFLNTAIGQREAYLAQRPAPGQGAPQPQPQQPEDPPEIEYETFDAREISGFFLPEIIAKSKSMPQGQGLKVIQNFEPVPLYDVMDKMGWGYVTRQAGAEEWQVFFYRKQAAVRAESEAEADPAPSSGRVPLVVQSATPVLYPVILRMAQSPALLEKIEFTEVKVWEETEKHLGWIAQGKADISFSAVMAVAKLLGKENRSLKFACVAVWDNFHLLTRREKTSSFADLRGQTIYMPLVKNSPPAKVTEYLMRATGEDPANFNFVFGIPGDPFGRPEEIARKLIAGEIETALLREPEASYALAGSDEVRVAAAYSDVWRSLHPASRGLPNAGVVFKGEFVSQHPQLARLFLDELQKAIDWVVANPDEAAQLSYETMGRTYGEVRRFLGRVRFEYVPACDAQDEIQDYLKMLEPSGKLRIAPESCELGF